MYSPNQKRSKPIDEEHSPLVIPPTYLRQIEYDKSSQRQLAEERKKLKATSRCNPDSAGECTEDIFAELVRNLIPDEFKVVTRARIEFDNPGESPQLDLVILKPGGEKRLNNLKSYPLSSVLAAFECKLTLRKRDLEKAALTANAIKCNYANGMASHTSPTQYEIGSCRPYFGILALGWEKGDDISLVTQFVDVLHESFLGCPVGRQVDCVLVPELSFYSICHSKDQFSSGIDMGVYYEPVLRPSHAKGVGAADVPSAMEKLPQHNPLTGFAYYLARVVHEFSANYDHMVSRYVYYSQTLAGSFRPHSPVSGTRI